MQTVRERVERVRESIDSRRRLPRWALVPYLMGLGGALPVAGFGFYWDVAWHIDRGRDLTLFTPAHTMIVIGLVGVFASAIAAAALYPQSPAPGAVRVAGRYVPAGALLLGACGAAALAGFPLDEFWHRMFGKDVTLWGPTHLLMIGGASFSPLGYAMLVTQARRDAGVRRSAAWRGDSARALGALLGGLSTFQAEFDFGVPQFRLHYHPVLLALAAGFGLVCIRAALGRGAALRAAVAFAVFRGALALALGAMGHTVPVFPLYLVEAVCVELVAAALPLRTGLRGPALAGAAVGTVGFAAEFGWSHAVMPNAWSAATVSHGLPLAVVAAVAAAVLGAEAGRRLGPGDAVTRRIPRPLLVGCGAAVVAALAIPYPRPVGPPVRATVTLDRTSGSAVVTASLRPIDAADGAEVFQVLAWQGGGRVIAPMRRLDAGTWRSSHPAPIDYPWKVSLRMQQGAEMKAIPLSFPPEPESGKPDIRPLRRQTVAFGSDVALLQREARGGPAWLVSAGYGMILGVVGAWLAIACLAFAVLGRRTKAVARMT